MRAIGLGGAVLTTIGWVLAGSPASAQIDPAGAGRTFAEAKAICERDGGALWGRTLCGPILLVEPATRAIIANQSDAEGRLKASGATYVGRLPEGELIANTSVKWSGVLWSQLIWPPPEDADGRYVMLAHEMFHRIQTTLGMVRDDGDNSHLDTLEGRYLLQLEWRALAKALTAATPRLRRKAVGDALLFRQERYRLFPKAAAGEGALEANEGVAEYTGVRLGLTTSQARTAFAVRDLSAFVGAPSFVRSFAYATGPAYGLLLDEADPEWKHKLASGARFDALLSTAWKIPAPAAASLARRAALYDDGPLRASEAAREAARVARAAEMKARLVDGPVLLLPLKGAGYQFNPQTLMALAPYGTVYPTVRLSGPWGVLEVKSGGALFDKARGMAAVAAPDLDAAHPVGEVWTLTLNPGWSIQPGERPGDYALGLIDGAGR